MIIKVIEFEEEVKTLFVDVTPVNYILIRKKLDREKLKIIDYLKNLKEIGKIKSIWRPKNKSIQDHLNELVIAKKQIDKSITVIKELYYKR